MSRLRTGSPIFPTAKPGRASWCESSGIERLEIGNFGDCKFVRDGVSELRIDWGPGYRLYFGRDGRIIVLLCGGDKRKQGADIEKAVRLWQEYANRKERVPRARH